MQWTSSRATLLLRRTSGHHQGRLSVALVRNELTRGISINSGINKGLRASRHAVVRRPERWGSDDPPSQRQPRSQADMQDGSSYAQQQPTRAARNEFGERKLWSGRAQQNKETAPHKLTTATQRRDEQRGVGARPAFPSASRPRDQRQNTSNSAEVAIPYTTAASTFVFGIRPIAAALRARRRKFYNLYLAGNPERNNLKYKQICQAAVTRGLTPKWGTNRFLIDKLKASIETNADSGPIIDDGACLEVSPLPQPPIKALGQYYGQRGYFDYFLAHQSQEDAEINGRDFRLRCLESDWRAPCLLWLHGVVDARNVGAILRSAVYFGVDGVIFSARGTASMSDGVIKSSTGAAEYIPIFKVEDSEAFVRDSQINGWDFYGTVAPMERTSNEDPQKRRFVRQPLTLDQLKVSPVLQGPCVIVLGNEDLGLPPDLTQKMNHRISIRGKSRAAVQAKVDSLNVSVAAAMFCERFLSERPPKREEEEPTDKKTTEDARLF